MRSRHPKVLHSFAGRSMLGHVLTATSALDPSATVVIVGHAREAVTAHLAEIAPEARAVVQHEQRGTGHAVRTGLAEIDVDLADTVIVVPGDAPLLQAETLAAFLAAHVASGAAATMLTSRVPDPTGYGRVVRAVDGSVERVVEHRDASPDELAIDEVSALVYAFASTPLRQAIEKLSTDNSQGEEYLPDVVAILRSEGLAVGAVLAPAEETAGVNDRVQLAAALRTYTTRLLEQHMRAGVTIVDPATTWIDADVVLEPDVTLLPGVQLLSGTTVARGAVVGPDCTLTATTVGAGAEVVRSVATGASIGPDCTVGPFSYLRPGTDLREGAKVGGYVEIKNSIIGAHSKVPHLSYVGDATVGERSNVGAGTIFVNYDGVTKRRSEVGDDVRIGSDNTLVAPVAIGNGAYTGAGTVVRGDVPAGALAVSMGPQRVIEGWVARKRQGTASAEHSAPSEPSAADRRHHDSSARPERRAPLDQHREYPGVSTLEVAGRKSLMLFSGRAFPELADEIAGYLGIKVTPTTARNFANGEIFIRPEESVRGSDAFVIQSYTRPINEWLVESLILVDALKRASAKRITVVAPFYPYARQDKKHRGREPISARLVADMFKTAGADRIMTIDLHTAQIQGFFDGPVDHLFALPLLTRYVREHYNTEDITVVSPDTGRVRMAEQWADRLGGTPLAFIHKTRDPLVPNQVVANRVVGDVAGRTCVLIDDMIDTGGTIVKASDILFEAGAVDVIIVATHGVLSPPATELLTDSKVSEVVITNTLPVRNEQNFDKLTVLSIAPMIAMAIREVFEDGSVTSLFEGQS